MLKWKSKLCILLATTSLLTITPSFSVKAFASENGTMMQYFEWNLPSNQTLWNKMKDEAPNLKNSGITSLWIPPAYKGSGGKNDVGYGVYDLYDLGEFNQKGAVPTKYGTKAQLKAAIKSAHASGLQVYGDIVLNQKMGAETTEAAVAVEVNPNNRNEETSDKHEIGAWTSFQFPGRNNKYSDFKWHWYHFDGVDWDENTKSKKTYKLQGIGKSWEWEVDNENQNFDYLMGADLDMNHPEVINETKKWGLWFTNTLDLDGYRLDAVKHIKFDFYKDWLNYQRAETGKELFTVGEYYTSDLGKLQNYINKTGRVMSLFDGPLQSNFANASNSGGYYNMKDIRNNTLQSADPTKAVTFVDNHDLQIGRDEVSEGSKVKSWFKPLAYTFILTREQGYPCVFYGDYYGIPSRNVEPMKDRLDKLLAVRKDYAYGAQHDYFDHEDVVGWTREGDSEHAKSGLASLISDGPGGSKWMYVGNKFAGKVFYDYTGNRTDKVTINNDGWGEFKVNGGSYSVWIQE